MKYVQSCILTQVITMQTYLALRLATNCSSVAQLHISMVAIKFINAMLKRKVSDLMEVVLSEI